MKQAFVTPIHLSNYVIILQIVQVRGRLLYLVFLGTPEITNFFALAIVKHNIAYVKFDL